MERCALGNENAAELVLAYGAQTIDADKLAAFEQHMLSCANCRELAAAQRSVWSALDAWEPQTISSDFDAKVYQRILSEEGRPWWRRLARANWPLRPAMPVVAACGVLMAVFMLRSPEPVLAPPASSHPQVRIEQVEHALDDIDMLQQLGVESTSPI
jgi:hypothetical protein